MTTPAYYLSRLIVIIFALFYSNISGAQVAINVTGSQPDNSAMLDVQSSGKGLLIPRMNSAQIAGIINPANGLIVFDTDKKSLSLFTSGKGWNRLEVSPSGRIYISETYPDTLYPSADYNYLGVFYQAYAFRKNFGILEGGWLAKTTSLQSSIERQFCYTGSVNNKILLIGARYGSQCDSCIVAYNVATDAIAAETVGYIKRFDQFTATVDTGNSRIFVYGGYQDFENLFSTPLERGYMYNYITGNKVLMDSVSLPLIRRGHSAIWASSVNKLLVFGGIAFGPVTPATLTNTLYAYDPVANNWTALATSPLSARAHHIAVYDGNDRMIIWGGDNNSGTNYYNGAVYTISTNQWSLITSVNAPARFVSNGSWTGTEMLLSSPNINPNAYDYLAYRYNPATNTWTSIPPIPAYLGKASIVLSNHLWSGSNLLQLAYLTPFVVTPTNVMWSYSPQSNTWTALAGPDLAPQEIAFGIKAGNETIINNYFGEKFFRYLPSQQGSPSYQVQDQEFHYYKKK